LWQRTIVAATLLGMTVALIGCSDDGDSPSSPNATATASAATAQALPPYTLDQATEPGPYDVGSITLDLVDTSRGTDANGGVPASNERKLTTEVWYPARLPADRNERNAPADNSGGPYPLIVFAHGYSALRFQSTTYTRHLASHGYIVAAPDFPLTNLATPGGPRFFDIVNQPQDVSFVIDQVVTQGEGAGVLGGAVDADDIGLTGHSGGAFTTLLAVYGPHGDDRIDAALPISGSGCFLTEEVVGDIDTPIMDLTGSEDLLVGRAGNRTAYDMANAPRYWVEIRGANHIRFADVNLDDELLAGRVRSAVAAEMPDASAAGELGDTQQECSGDPVPAGEPKIDLARQQELLRTFATPFFDAYLKRDPTALRFLRDDLPGLTQEATDYEFDAP
jgi:predicted dienelactone hydrolase